MEVKFIENVIIEQAGHTGPKAVFLVIIPWTSSSSWQTES